MKAWAHIRKHNRIPTTKKLGRFETGVQSIFVYNSGLQWRNTGRWPASRSHADRFIYSGRNAASVGHRILVARSNCSRIATQSKSNRRCNHRLKLKRVKSFDSWPDPSAQHGWHGDPTIWWPWRPGFNSVLEGFCTPSKSGAAWHLKILDESI